MGICKAWFLLAFDVKTRPVLLCFVKHAVFACHSTARGSVGVPVWADCATDVGAETAHEAGTLSALYTMPNLWCSFSSTLLKKLS